jgi:outer membrane protein
VINVERLVQESALGKEAFGRVRKLNEQKKEEGDKLSKELRDMEQKLADQGSALAEDKREALQKSYQEKAIAFKRFQDDANRDLEAAQKKELGELERRVFPIINQVGKEKGFTVIFNKFQSGLVYADEAVDVTDDVLKVFNDRMPAATGAAKRRRSRTGPDQKPNSDLLRLRKATRRGPLQAPDPGEEQAAAFPFSGRLLHARRGRSGGRRPRRGRPAHPADRGGLAAGGGPRGPFLGGGRPAGLRDRLEPGRRPARPRSGTLRRQALRGRRRAATGARAMAGTLPAAGPGFGWRAGPSCTSRRGSEKAFRWPGARPSRPERAWAPAR